MASATLQASQRVSMRRASNGTILRVKDEPGRYEWIGLGQLHIDRASDGGYQRDAIGKKRIAAMVAEWSWVACGALIVALRKDGTYLVIDGQHRKLAADQREDITALPCLIFNSVAVADEAKAFLNINDHRGPIKSYARFLAALRAMDQLALQTKEMVESTGYQIVENANGRKFCVSCIKAISNGVKSDPLLAEKVWRMCCDLYSGDQVMDRAFMGLFALERTLIKRGGADSIFGANNRNKLAKVGISEVMKGIRKAIEYKGTSGEKVLAQGIVDVLNASRSSNRIDPIC